jgi:hypothetical protein
MSTPMKPKPLQVPIDSMPEFAAALGRFMSHWAIVESELTNILGWVLRVNQPRAQILFMSIINVKTKLRSSNGWSFTSLLTTKRKNAY